MSSNEELISTSFLPESANEEVIGGSMASEGDDEDEEDVEVEAMDEDDIPGGGRANLLGLGSDGVIAQLIDIREPLINLRKALERRLHVDLSEHDFWLQDSQLLPENTTLVEQCVQGEGLVQINVEIKSEGANVKKINIIDVLKPSEEMTSEGEDDGPQPPARPSPPKVVRRRKKSSLSQSSQSSQDNSVTRWVVCASFRKEQERLSMPTDPVKWNPGHVTYWIKWAIDEFPKAAISLEDWSMDGKELCSMSHEDFKKKVPIDPSDLMWTHLELLRKCKFVAVVQKPDAAGKSGSSGGSPGSVGPPSLPRKTNKKPPVRLGAAKFTVMSESALGNRTGNNGQVQLWQFLLELLTEHDKREVIHWIGDEGEFKLENPEMVAQLWGTRKNKPNMNYEKLSRALRYYYDGDMISKVHGKRFVYKFVCDLRQLIGYSAAELNALVIEAEQKAFGKMYI